MKRTSVVVRGLPALESTTERSLSSSHWSIVSVPSHIDLASLLLPRNEKTKAQLTSKLLLPTIRIQILLLDLPPDVHVMTELTLAALVTAPRLIEGAQYSFGVNAERNLLDLDWTKQGSLLLRPFGLFGLGLLAHGLFFLLFEGVARLSGQGLLFLDRGDLGFDFG